ncbi:dipeptidase 1 precursor [Pyrenophora tritici-repentis Pt-1C-BFP]|uniref:Dipeptidase n=1 Tax=Pyrenophora tritici-repentis (strain Pt-1C-BFP) TaxID=426418 RepID=B2WFS3_PYRTR|nr:dipeptidase 1 precursor [Pyrenophora tritici-repentis Pt-1C-BFP]EDU41830.1 dipeptidase 1 precursor [Pyrenophora tritici-repentis Pt-1C-BFP]
MIFIRSTYQNHIYNASGSDFADKWENGGLAQHVDVPRLEKGKQGGAFWSAFWPCPTSGNGTDFSDARYYDSKTNKFPFKMTRLTVKVVQSTISQLDLFGRLGQQYPKYFTSSKTSAEAAHTFENGGFIAPVIIEGLHQIGNSISNLRLYHQLGVRYATLTWNCHNKYADAALQTEAAGSGSGIAKPYWHGLSPAGRELVKEMNRLGMLVDLAHVSQDTMRDVLVGKGETGWNGSLAPPIFSHSSAYAICPHPRNVPDDILQLVKQRNSIVMVNFNPEFVSCKPANTTNSLPDFVPETNTLAQVVRHIRHIGELIGYDHVGIGTDYDGIESTPVGLEDVSKFPDLFAELLRQGISDEDAAKIAGRNILRVWAEADKVASELQKTTLPLEDDVKNNWVKRREL